jgi:hypothetical protein
MLPGAIVESFDIPKERYLSLATRVKKPLGHTLAFERVDK